MRQSITHWIQMVFLDCFAMLAMTNGGNAGQKGTLRRPSYSLALLIAVILTGCAKTPVTGLRRSYETYHINGIPYKAQDYYEYDETGLASWYGPGFHGRQKATGQRYNQNSLTAAHRTMVIPSIARVTNLNTGKSQVVLIDDRGPYHDTENRKIDLSKLAAERLGVIGPGTAPVRIECLVEESQEFSNYLKQGNNRKKNWEHLFHQMLQDGKIPDSASQAGAQPQVIQTVYTPQSDHKGSRLAYNLNRGKDFKLKKRQQMPIVRPDRDLPSPAPRQAEVIQTSYQNSLPPRRPTQQQTHLIQVGIYFHKENATHAQKDLERLSRTIVHKRTLKGGHKMYAVQMGPFKSKQHAQDLQATLCTAGYNDVMLLSKSS